MDVEVLKVSWKYKRPLHHRQEYIGNPYISGEHNLIVWRRSVKKSKLKPWWQDGLKWTWWNLRVTMYSAPNGD